MKKILFVFLLLTTTLSAQQINKKWATVLSYENEGKIKSANEIVTKIYKKAVNKKDEVQMIKCFFYQSKYLQVLDENVKTKILNNLKTDINRVSPPSKAILNLVYAKCLDHYLNNDYDNVSVVIDSAAAVVEEANTLKDTTATVAIDTIAVNKIPESVNENLNFITEQEIITTYQKTLENEAILRSTSLTKYQAIFDYLTLEKLKSESLYDYLLRENIAFFSTKVNEWEIQKSDIETHKTELLGNSTLFFKLDLGFIKDENLQKVLSLYQKLESVKIGRAHV